MRVLHSACGPADVLDSLLSQVVGLHPDPSCQGETGLALWGPLRSPAHHEVGLKEGRL